MDLLLDTYKLMKAVQKKKKERFSGIGIVVYDEKTFDSNRHCDLRPDIKCPKYHITDDKICDYLAEISSYNHDLHDGFVMVDSNGYLSYVAQYFVPPIVKGLMPNQYHGVRLYSSMCGSMIKGVVYIATISSDEKIFIFKNGEYVDIDELEERLLNE